ncbi:energy-coupling factor transporter transmembrane component T family protein [Mycoplasma leonicaptivi]|uniref:energy-coupling factor transporter transmembrane component T family protein n=1 Tax=Mycoplasma leonicaptivi TaxID=36742 RepID=UPI00048351E3|nr:energy-coupling factor transporter transmembrane component T [Mycoplasma leonicaptivi]
MKSVFGRYLHGNTFLYKIDPRLKVLLSILFIIMVFIASSFIDMITLASLLIFVYYISIKKIRPIFKLMKVPLIISLVLFIVNIYTINSEVVYSQKYYNEYFWAFITSSKELKVKVGSEIQNLTWEDFYKPEWYGNLDLANYYKNLYGNKAFVQYGISLNSISKIFSLFLRIYIMILVTTLLTNTTRPILLNKSIESLLTPLKLIFIPTHIIATIISIALRFIPTLVDESHRIIKAQSSRGVDFKNGTAKDKVIAFTTLIIPLFVSSFQKADDLANAMETRGYDPYEKRTKYRKIKPTWRDLVLVLFIIIIISFMILNYLVIKNTELNTLNEVSKMGNIGYYTLPEWFYKLRIVS